MSQPGSNLPDFTSVQLDFAAHIRNPEANPRPTDVEARRMQIYLDLVYNNIEGFLAGAFPIAKQLLLERDCWDRLARHFVHHHASSSPYFLEISQEYLSFLGEEVLAGQDPRFDGLDLPDYLLELCHYEWVELALRVDDREVTLDGVDREGDLMSGAVVLNPVVWPLAYRYPVHQIGPEHANPEPAAEPVRLIVYRRLDDGVRFLECSIATQRLLEALQDADSGADAVETLVNELSQVDAEVVRARASEALSDLHASEIVLGVATH